MSRDCREMDNLRHFRSLLGIRKPESNGSISANQLVYIGLKTEVVTPETRDFFQNAWESHHKPDNSMVRKITAHTSAYHLLKTDPRMIPLHSVNVEEMIIYFLFILLLLFLFVYMVRCVRTTLDPYNTVARVAWLETLEKRDSKVFPSLGLRAGAGTGQS